MITCLGDLNLVMFRGPRNEWNFDQVFNKLSFFTRMGYHLKTICNGKGVCKSLAKNCKQLFSFCGHQKSLAGCPPPLLARRCNLHGQIMSIRSMIDKINQIPDQSFHIVYLSLRYSKMQWCPSFFICTIYVTPSIQ